MSKIISFLLSCLRGVLFDGIKFAVFIGVIIMLSLKYKWTSGMTFEQWYLQISGCDLNNAINNARCLITNPVACWHCQMFDSVWNIMHFTAYKFYNFFAGISMTIIVFAFAFWLLTEMFFKKIATGDPKVDPKAFWKDVIIKMFKIVCAVVMILTLRVSGAVKYGMEPVLITGTFFARSAITSVIDIDRCSKLNVNNRIPKFLDDMIKDESKSSSLLKELTNGNDATVFYQSSVKNELMCMVWNLQTMLLTGISGGVNIIQEDANPFNKLIGIGIVVIFFMLGWSVLFDLLDIIISLGFLLILTPFVIAGYAVGGMFKIPNLLPKWVSTMTGTAFYLFIYSFSLCVLYISLYYLIDVLYYYSNPLSISSNGEMVKGLAFNAVNANSKLVYILNGADVPSGTFPNLLVIFAYGIMTFSLFDLVKKYRDKFSMWNIGFADYMNKTLLPTLQKKFAGVERKAKGKFVKGFSKKK